MLLKKHVLIFRLILRLNINNNITQEKVPREAFTYSKSNLETLKKCEICSKLIIKTPEQISTVFIVNFGHISYLFLVFLLITLNK